MMDTTTDPVVFIVDDDYSVRISISRLLRAAGYATQLFGSAEEFLRSEPPGRPSCVVLDICMPGLSGLDLQGELVKADLDLPVIFITGQGDIPMSVKAIRRGAVDFLEKPFDDADLLSAVRRALRHDRDAWRERDERREIRRRFAMLTEREREVLELVIKGLLNKQIGGRLGISEKTVKVHRGRMMEKMRADSVPDLLLVVRKIGIDPQ